MELKILCRDEWGQGGGLKQCDGYVIRKTMWNAAIMFMWTACQNLLPTKVNLLGRRVVQDATKNGIMLNLWKGGRHGLNTFYEIVLHPNQVFRDAAVSLDEF
jgi:hypothetical protein